MSEEYLKAQQALHVIKGERVLILRRAASGENGWVNSWCMDRYVDTIGTVMCDNNEAGIKVRHIDGMYWNYPYFVLAFVERLKI